MKIRLEKPYINTENPPHVKVLTKRQKRQAILEGIKIIRAAAKIREDARKIEVAATN